MLPLAGIRVVTIALNVPGPLAASHLRDQGAQITKIEPPQGDPLEGFCPAWYAELHAGIAVERLDLKTDAGGGRVRALLTESDFFLASQRPAALARLGLDTAKLLAPDSPTAHLRWLNIVGEVARPEIAGHDLTYLARARLLGAEVPRTLIADVLGAERAFATALLLLRQPPGAHTTIGLFDSLGPLTSPLVHRLTGPDALLGGKLAAYGIYEAREGRIAIAALEPHFRARLYAELHLPIDSDLTAAFKARTATDWEEWALKHDLPICAIPS
jgi:alpha-methylacyl-CoA racemase